VSRALPLLVVLGVLAGASPARAIDVTASLDRATAHVGEQVVLTVQVSGGIGSIPDPKLPDLGANFEVYTGRTSQSYSLINGHMSASKTLMYALVPKKAGTFTIAPIEVHHGKEVVRAQPVKLTVLAGPAPSTAPTPPRETRGETGSTRGSEDLFVRATADKSDPYLYEQVTYRVRLYTRVGLLDNPGFSAPTTQGFWKEDLPALQPRLETVNGKRYRVLEVDMAVFPTTPGKLTIGESVLQCTVQGASRANDPFSFFGGNPFDSKRVTLRTDPVVLHVKALPPGAPPGFHGAVGEYTLTASVDKTTVAQNEPVTLTVKVSGEGNLKTLGDIELPKLPDFRTYPSQSNEETTRAGMRIGGTVTRQFVLVPLSAGTKEVPALRVATFSPKSGAYDVLRSDPISLTVTPAGRGAEGSGSASRGDIQVLGRDIRFIETDVPSFVSRGGAWNRARVWFYLLPLPALGYAGVWVFERRRRRLGRDTALRRRLGAARDARKLLKGAAGASETERVARAGEAVRNYLADRYNLPRAGLLFEDVEARLRDDGADPEAIRGFLDRADAARYAPSVAGAEGTDWLVESRCWIDTLEKTR
jgi:hypothetical protein